MKRLVTIAVSLVLAASFTAACGKDKKTDTAASTGGETTAAGGSTVSVTATDFKFDPETLTAKAGEATTFTIKNDGAVKHNLTIKDLKVNADVDKGKSASQSVTPTAGTFEYHCEYHPTQMKGELTVS